MPNIKRVPFENQRERSLIISNKEGKAYCAAKMGYENTGGNFDEKIFCNSYDVDITNIYSHRLLR